MKEKKLWYVITCHYKHEQLNEESTYLVRMVDDILTAKQLMQSIYDDAENGITGRHGVKYSNPKWLDEKHLKLQITSDITSMAGCTVLLLRYISCQMIGIITYLLIHLGF